jgi:hypothetical protein
MHSSHSPTNHNSETSEINIALNVELLGLPVAPINLPVVRYPFLAHYGFRVVSEGAVLIGHPGAVSLDFLRYERTRKSRDRGEDAPERSLGEAAARNAIRTKNPQWC